MFKVFKYYEHMFAGGKTSLPAIDMYRTKKMHDMSKSRGYNYIMIRQFLINRRN